MNALVKEPAILWTDVGAVTDIPRRGARRVPSPRGDIAIFRTGDGAVFALMDKCPHKGGPLSQGIVPVSYTHLDVYKRQPPPSAWPRSWPAPTSSASWASRPSRSSLCWRWPD